MRVNVYAEEMTDRVEIITKTIDGQDFTGLRIYLELPVTQQRETPLGGRFTEQVRGPFMHRPGDDDSAAVTFWGKRGLREVLKKALAMLDEHYTKTEGIPASWEQMDYALWVHTNGATVRREKSKTGTKFVYVCFPPGTLKNPYPVSAIATSFDLAEALEIAAKEQS